MTQPPALSNGHRGQFKEGDHVRDLDNLGGQVLETWGNGVKVSWRNGYTTWIDERFLRLDTK